MDRETQEKLYAKEMGEEALERQQRLAKELCTWCGFKKPHHHPLCQLGKGKRDG